MQTEALVMSPILAKKANRQSSLPTQWRSRLLTNDQRDCCNDQRFERLGKGLERYCLYAPSLRLAVYHRTAEGRPPSGRFKSVSDHDRRDSRIGTRTAPELPRSRIERAKRDLHDAWLRQGCLAP